FFFTPPPPTSSYTLSLHDALPISRARVRPPHLRSAPGSGSSGAHDSYPAARSSRGCAVSEQKVEFGIYVPQLGFDYAQIRERARSEEHTSELQSLAYLVCRLLLEK